MGKEQTRTPRRLMSLNLARSSCQALQTNDVHLAREAENINPFLLSCSNIGTDTILHDPFLVGAGLLQFYRYYVEGDQLLSSDLENCGYISMPKPSMKMIKMNVHQYLVSTAASFGPLSQWPLCVSFDFGRS